MDSAPGTKDIKMTEEVALFAAGPDNQHKRFLVKGTIKSSVTDAGNTGYTTTIRGGNVLAMKESDGLLYLYDADANDGTQVPVGLIGDHLFMGDGSGGVEDKFTRVTTQGIIKNFTDLLGEDLYAAAVLLRMGFTFAQLEPHGSAFGLHMKGTAYKDGTALAGAYTVLATDHGWRLMATTAAMNFTLPDLATVGKGFQVMLVNAVDANMIVTAAANTILAGDAGGAPSTTITFSTANRKLGAVVLMEAVYDAPGGALAWLPIISGGGTPAYA